MPTATTTASTTATATATGSHPAGRPRRSANSGPKKGPASNSTDNNSGNGSSAPALAAGSSDTRVQAALAAGQDLTVLDIAQTTGLGRSTVGKALNRLAATGHATRTPSVGTGPTRTPERWNPGSTDHNATTEAGPTTTADPTTTATPGAGGTGAGIRSEATTDAVQVGTTPTPTPETVPPATPARTVAGRAALPSEVDGTARNPVTGAPKLAPGALTPLVAGHFAAHPATPLTAGEVGRALHRSGGAVRNACDRLVRDGDLAVASDSPRRYILATPS